MKNYILLLIAFICSTSVFSQKIEEIDYGANYYQLKEKGYFDFKMDCLNGWYPSSLENDAVYKNSGYANSNFQTLLKSKDYQLGNLYKTDLTELGNEFHKNHNKLHSGFKKGSKKVFNYVKLHLEKFEIISEYYKDLYNYKLDKKEEEELISLKMDSINQNNTEIINEMGRTMNNDEELKSIKNKKDESINAINKKYDSEINKLENEKKEKISNLGMSNYTQRKDEIVKEYEPQINKLKIDKQKNIQDAEAYWDDKIKNRKSAIDNEIDEKEAEIENNKIVAQNNERKEIKSINNLDNQIEIIENNYEKATNDINTKISELLEK